nr:LEA type 2 family protein [Rhodocyclus tenuis]
MLVAAVTLAACAGIGVPTKPPEVSFAGIEWQHGNLAEQHFALKLRVDNPNAQALPLQEVVIDLELAGQRFASGRSTVPLSVPAKGDATLVVDVSSDLRAVLRLVREARRDGRQLIDYRIRGEVEVDGFGRHPFERSGAVPAERIEKRLLRAAPAQ